VSLTYQDSFGNPGVSSVSATDVLVDPSNAALQRLTVTLGTSFSSLSSSFPSTFLGELATLLSLSNLNQLRVLSVGPSDTGKTVVTFEILPALLTGFHGTNGSLAMGYQDNALLADAFKTLFNTPTSLLYATSGTFLSTAVSSAGLVVTPICQNPQQVIIGCPTSSSTRSNTPNDDSNDTFIRWLIIGISLLVLAILIIIGVLVHKRDQKAKEEALKKEQEAEQHLIEYERSHPDRPLA